jgi:hypothetical protein
VTRRLIITFAVMCALIYFAWWSGGWPSSRQARSSTRSTATARPAGVAGSSTPRQAALTPSHANAVARRREGIQKVVGALQTPIAFYGRVVDQNGEPVPNAAVEYSTIDRFDADGSKYKGESDASGNFAISGIQGAVLTVGVGKSGYYSIHGRSDGAFAYGVGTDSTRRSPPTKENPSIFVLHKMGPTEPLISLSSRQINVPPNGNPLTLDLATGRLQSGNLQIESWIGDTSTRRFNWRYRLSVSNGGIAQRNGQFDFEAPSDGYRDSIEVNMLVNSETWSSSISKDYFARLPDGRYARFSVTFYPGKRNFVVLESYLNPTPGDRNLEFDPAKQIKVK